MRKDVKKKSGFTLIELIIVISIIAVLAAIGVPKYGNIQKDAKIKADIASAKVIADAATMLIGNDEITLDYRVGIALTEGDKISNYLQKTPVVKAIEGGKFIVKIDDKDSVTVTVLSSTKGTFNLYPTPDKDYPTVTTTPPTTTAP